MNAVEVFWHHDDRERDDAHAPKPADFRSGKVVDINPPVVCSTCDEPIHVEPGKPAGELIPFPKEPQ